MSKEINCTFQMGGTYHLEERSVLAAQRKAMGNLPLPEDRDYVDDSLMVDELNECMVANGWSYEEVDELSRFSADALTRMITSRISAGLESIPSNSHTTTRLKEFLLDYYDVEYAATQDDKQKLKPTDYTEKPCCIVIHSNYADGRDVYAFDSKEIAKESVDEDIKTVKKSLSDSGYEFKVTTKPGGEIEITAADGDIYYTWEIFPSTIMVKSEFNVRRDISIPEKHTQQKNNLSPAPTPQPPAAEKLVTELCPNCESEVTLSWDTATMGFKTFCPHCGEVLMLCSECRRSSGVCDFDEEGNFCKHNISGSTVPSSLGLNTPKGLIVAHIEEADDERNMVVALRRPGTLRDLPLARIGYIPGSIGGVSVLTCGDGKKSKANERVFFEDTEKFFQENKRK